MAGKAEEHAQGLAERSVNTSIVHPSQDASNRQPRDGRSRRPRLGKTSARARCPEESSPLGLSCRPLEKACGDLAAVRGLERIQVKLVEELLRPKARGSRPPVTWTQLRAVDH